MVDDFLRVRKVSRQRFDRIDVNWRVVEPRLPFVIEEKAWVDTVTEEAVLQFTTYVWGKKTRATVCTEYTSPANWFEHFVQQYQGKWWLFGRKAKLENKIACKEINILEMVPGLKLQGEHEHLTITYQITD